jgi:hypothetical protein
LAINHLTTNYRRWNAALADSDAAEAATAAIKDHPNGRVRDDIVALTAEAVDRVYRVPAPTLGGLRRKLELFWTDLWDETYGADFKKIVVGDLVRLELLLAGVDPYEASGGMDLEKVAADFAEAAGAYDHYIQLLREGPSEAWGTSSSSDITALMDEAEAKMLSLSAPTLGAVLKKLTILFSDDRFCEIDEAAAHGLILRDLRRFITKHHQ